MKEFTNFVNIAKEMANQNTRASHITFVDGDKKDADKYQENYGHHCKRVILHDKYEIGCLVNHTPYSPDMDTSGSAIAFKVNPNLGESGHALALYAEDLLKIAMKISSVECIPKNWDEVKPIKKSAIYCEHANEMPAVCPCDADCYCKDNSCKNR